MKSTHKLSIIMPCYNCVATLEEAVASIYRQDLSIPFEVVMVDDGSTDNTYGLIVELAKKYPYIRYFAHKTNKGGGAARNTAVDKTDGNLIFCLDSDNILAPNTLQRMVDYLNKKQCDAVAFGERRFFIGGNKDKYTAHHYAITERPITIPDLFSDSNILLDNFLYTKQSFYNAGRYPENHGFDTQCYEMRYLVGGNVLYICPDVAFYHRQAFKNKSYFERVYASGDFSKNYYLIFEDIIFLFSSDVRRKILAYDIFRNTKLGENNLKSFLDNLYQEAPEQFFIKDADRYMHQHGFNAFCDDHKDSDDLMDIYCLAIRAYQVGNYDRSMEYYKKLIKGRFDTKIAYFNMLRVLVAMSGAHEVAQVENKTSDLVGMFAPVKQSINLSPNIFIKGLLKIRHLIERR